MNPFINIRFISKSLRIANFSISDFGENKRIQSCQAGFLGTEVMERDLRISFGCSTFIVL